MRPCGGLDLGDNLSIPCQNVDQGFCTSGDSILDRVLGFFTLPMHMNQDCDYPPKLLIYLRYPLVSLTSRVHTQVHRKAISG